MTKVGTFTATLTLEHATKTDATITGAQFEISKTASALPILLLPSVSKLLQEVANSPLLTFWQGFKVLKRATPLKVSPL